MLRGELPAPYELRAFRKDGSICEVEVTLTPIIENGEVAYALGIARDVTDRRQLEDQLRQSQKMESIGQLAEIGRKNVGLVLDSWHWYTAHEAEGDILALSAGDVVAVDLNDAPAGKAVDEQVDSQRELPCATGVIDAGAFLRALARIGYDGPVRAEPFNAALRALPPEEAVAATARAMKAAFAKLG